MERERTHEGSSPTLTRPLLLDGDDVENVSNNPKIEVENNSSVTVCLVFSTFIAVCGSFSYGSALGYSSPAETGIIDDLDLSIAQYSVFGSIMTIGGMVGAILSGKLSDLIGRKRTMWLSQVLCTPGWLAITFAKNAWWLDTGRLLIGFGVGLITYVVPVYIAEISPKNVRGRLIWAHELLMATGFALQYYIGNIVTWRVLAVIGNVPCLVQIIGLFFIPESPRWLAKCGKEKEFESSLQKLRGSNADISQETSDIKEILETFQIDNSSEGGFIVLFQRRYAYPIIVGVGIMLLQQLGGDAGISYYLSTVFRKAGFSTEIATKGISLIQVPMAIVALLLVDVFGRKTLLYVSTIGCSICLLLVALAFYLKDLNILNEITPTFIFICLLVYYAVFIIGLSGIPWILMSEIFPVNVKATGGSLVTLTNWFTSWLVTLTVNFVMEWSIIGTFCIFGTMCALNALFVWKFVPETKGKTLEEIQTQITEHPWSSNC